MRQHTTNSSNASFLVPTHYENKSFEFSLIVSFLMHIVIFAILFYSNMHYTKETQKNIEIIYQTHIQKAKAKVKADVKSLRSVHIKHEKLNPGVFKKANAAIPPQLKEAGKRPVKFEITKKTLSAMPMADEKRHISVPFLDSEKISSPRYLDYHERIRNKIKKRAYLYVDNPQFESGEVYLTFVLLADGSLKAIKILKDKTEANDYLRNVGLRSIRESSPFPPFPQDLKYPELSFNVVIAFEISR